MAPPSIDDDLHGLSIDASLGMENMASLVFLLLMLECQDLGDNKSGWRRSGNGGPQTCLPVDRSVAPSAALYDPSSPANIQDPREGPSLARWMTQDLFGGGLTKLAREGWRDQGKGHLARSP